MHPSEDCSTIAEILERPILFRPLSNSLLQWEAALPFIMSMAIIQCYVSGHLKECQRRNENASGGNKANEFPVGNRNRMRRTDDMELPQPRLRKDTQEKQEGIAHTTLEVLDQENISEIISDWVVFISIVAESFEWGPDGALYAIIRPRSSVQYSDLDQIVAFVIGVMTLCCTLRDIIASRRRAIGTLFIIFFRYFLIRYINT
jgi:hypothetical protein